MSRTRSYLCVGERKQITMRRRHLRGRPDGGRTTGPNDESVRWMWEGGGYGEWSRLGEKYPAHSPKRDNGRIANKSRDERPSRGYVIRFRIVRGSERRPVITDARYFCFPLSHHVPPVATGSSGIVVVVRRASVPAADRTNNTDDLSPRDSVGHVLRDVRPNESRRTKQKTN